MSFDLLFYKLKDAKIKLDEVVNYFYNQQNFTVKPLADDFYQFIYNNPLTNVTFTLVYNEAIDPEIDLAFDDNYEFCYTYFFMDYLRPTFYAAEAMPVIEKFMQNFGLFIYNIQGDKTIKQFSKDELIASYQANNETAAKEFNEQYPLLHTSKEKLDYYYKYTTAMENKDDDIIIPEISFIKDKENNVYSVISWDDLSDTYLPKTDYILITRKHKALLGIKKKTSSLVPYEEVISKLKNWLEKGEDDIYLFTKSENQEAYKKFYELPEYDYQNYEIVSTDEIVDVL